LSNESQICDTRQAKFSFPNDIFADRHLCALPAITELPAFSLLLDRELLFCFRSITDSMADGRMVDEKNDASVGQYIERRDDDSFPATGENPEKMSVGRYLATRFSSLKPPMDRVENPISLLATLNKKQWLFFLLAFLGWTWVCGYSITAIIADLVLTTHLRMLSTSSPSP
jgi:hypothetical protein